MREKKINLKLIILVTVLLILGIIWLLNFNGLSKSETVDRFLRLCEQGEYEKAKKYTTMRFESERGLIYFGKNTLSENEYFTYSYGDYKLEDADVAYIRWKTFSHASIMKFRLKNTIWGVKIDDCEQENIDF